MTPSNVARALGIGAATGLRSMTGPAFAFAGTGGNGKWLLRAGAVGEYVVDKLPKTPSRTQPAGLIARAVAAAIAGATIDPDDRALGAAYAVAGAMATSYAGAAYRKLCADRKLPLVATAIAEDILAMILARLATTRTEK